MLRTNPTLRCIVVLVALLAGCLLGAAILRANLSRPVVTGGRMPTVRTEWSIPASGARWAAFAGSGDYVCTVSKDGQLACYDSTGARRFSTTVVGANAASVAPNGSFTLAYARRNPGNTSLIFLDSTGRVAWRMNVSGAVWSADAGLSDSGACFAVGTGERYVYMITVGPGAKRYRRWRAPGVVTSVALDSNHGRVLSGTWQASSVCGADLTGREDLAVEADPSTLQYVQALADSDRVFVRSIANRAGGDGRAALLESDGLDLSHYTLDGSQSMRAVASPDGLFVCLGYSKAIEHSGKSMAERHAALYDYAGRRLWDKGSMLLQVTPIVVTRGGFVLAGGGKNALYMVNPAGQIKQACKLPAPLVEAIVSRDSSLVLARCANGRFYRLRIAR